MNSLFVYTSNWIRIEFYSNQIYTDDHFRGKSLTVMMKVLYCQVELKQNMLNSDLVTFELWDEKLFTITKYQPKSAINIAEVYWQGLDSNFNKQNGLKFN